MSDTKAFHERQRDVNCRAGRVLAFTSNAPINAAMSVEQQAETIFQTAAQDPMFEGVDPKAVRQIATAWAASVADYRRINGCNPPADLLANAQNACENLIWNQPLALSAAVMAQQCWSQYPATCARQKVLCARLFSWQ